MPGQFRLLPDLHHPEENNSGIDIFGVGNIARERDRLFRKVYHNAHLVDDFTQPFIIPHVGLHGALTRQRNRSRLAACAWATMTSDRNRMVVIYNAALKGLPDKPKSDPLQGTR